MLYNLSPLSMSYGRLATYLTLILAQAFTGLTPLLAQNYHVNPESAVYDASASRTLVSNTGNGDIVAVDLEGNQTIFNSGLSSVRGVTIVEDKLWVAATEGVASINLATGEQEELIVISGAVFLNDITTDGADNLYVTDSNAARIYRIYLPDLSFTQFVASALATPNGLYFDGANDRLLLVSFRSNSPLQAVSLADSSVSTIINTTLDNLDGIARDNQGRFYVSSWSTGSTYRIDTDFSGEWELFSDGHAGPADLGFDGEHSLLVVPNFNSNSVDYLLVEGESVPGQPDRSDAGFMLSANYPNPFNNSTVIPFSLSHESLVSLELYHINGRRAAILLDENRGAGDHQFVCALEDFPSGTYLYKLTAGNYVEARKMTLIR